MGCLYLYPYLYGNPFNNMVAIVTEELTMLRGKYCPYHEELVGPAPWVYQEWLKRLNPTTLLGITKGRLSFDSPPGHRDLLGNAPANSERG